ncbi:15990_t:CDS:2, partial [Racocetra fulgida]
LLLPIEVKTQWVLFINNELLHERYNNDLKQKNTLYISPTIEIKSEHPSILKCYAYIQNLARQDTNSPSPDITPPTSPLRSYDEFSDNTTSDSEYENPSI